MRGSRRAGMALLVTGVIGLVAALGAATGSAAGGEGPITVQMPEWTVSFGFGVSPKVLPSGEPGAAALKFAMEEEALPVERSGIGMATIGLDKSIALEARGLPVCPFGIQIDAAGPSECPRAIVGHAEAMIEFAFPEQVPFKVHSNGKIYNGGVHRGVTRFMVELPLGPPLNESLYLTALVRHVSDGRIGSEATIKIPTISVGSGHLYELNLELGRSFMRHGERVAYVGAECRDGKLVASWSVVLTDGTKASSEATRACTRQ